ncbi:pancreatic triacylglycerol lipase [Strongylocentrotus purpuratus]|uniref:Lipase domain-containing protein n=1 Tax=Strongylocentrotus purpuratus TaxID=7668 RepID=A0A7M7RBH3_STRPU|nr:pancreatic triacylglycerol lipase [Strongylocentrotus purpuratus]|eukprot:XP_781104.2 PREDICTED: pancreatic triacylglycerol lipase [Strongylocentrotus purpuratus]
MGSLSLAVVFLAAAIIQGCQADSVQYDDLDRLYYGDGAPACHHFKPESPDAIVIRYWLYTNNNKYSPQELDRYDASSITNSNFQSSRDTKFIIHGYTDEYTSSWFQSMKNALVDKNTNVIMVDWEEGAARVNYAQSRANTRVVGQDIGKLIEVLNSKGASYSSMHIIGHSLGAHTAGYAGESRSGIGRLTGLDPAGAEFTGYDSECTIDKSDATFVDNIHTDGELTGAGLLDQLGHQDFYPNGGESQPGCEGTSITAACDHMRAVYLFTESIYSSCNFSPTMKCTNWSSYPNCNSCGTCPEMGYGALQSKGEGAYYLTTDDGSPYCN